jgi:hypothetical protein
VGQNRRKCPRPILGQIFGQIQIVFKFNGRNASTSSDNSINKNNNNNNSNNAYSDMTILSDNDHTITILIKSTAIEFYRGVALVAHA